MRKFYLLFLSMVRREIVAPLHCVYCSSNLIRSHNKYSLFIQPFVLRNLSETNWNPHHTARIVPMGKLMRSPEYILINLGNQPILMQFYRPNWRWFYHFTINFDLNEDFCSVVFHILQCYHFQCKTFERWHRIVGFSPRLIPIISESTLHHRSLAFEMPIKMLSFD